MLNFKIVTPDGVTYHDEVDEVTVPTSTGQISILTSHIPLVSVIVAGEVAVKKGETVHRLSTSGGIIEVRPGNEVYVLADTAERAEHIDIDRALLAKKRAEVLLSEQKQINDVDFARIQAAIEKETVRIHVGRKHRGISMNISE